MRSRASGERNSWDTSRSNCRWLPISACKRAPMRLKSLASTPRLVAAGRQARQRLLLIGRLAEVVHGTAQAIQRSGDGQRQQQAEAGQHHQSDAQRTQRPGQAAAVPGLQFGMRNTVDEQVGFAGGRAGVVGGQASPGQWALAILMARLEGGSAGGEGTADDRLAVFGQYLYINPCTMAVLFEQPLSG